VDDTVCFGKFQVRSSAQMTATLTDICDFQVQQNRVTVAWNRSGIGIFKIYRSL